MGFIGGVGYSTRRELYPTSNPPSLALPLSETRLSSATLTALAARLLWLLLLPGILPAFAFSFPLALLTSSADFLFFFVSPLL